ncbi:MAG: isoprenylcysteine carboxylmethyltransferase family protein [Acidobacteria bacterium]|nr:isoprenylcysteine carboxylmethyltransferase family protein [Acidobacteriota bacterium]
MGNNFSAFVARWRVPFGFALGIAYLVFAQPTVPSLIAGSTVALVGLGIRAYSAGHLIKDQALATGGPYAYTRNPLYLGSFLLGIGLVLAGAQWVLGVVFVVFFLVVYFPVMRREARNLRQRFGREYEDYAADVPLFFPFRRPLKPSKTKFEWKRYRSNREHEAALGYLAGVIFLIVKILLR